MMYLIRSCSCRFLCKDAQKNYVAACSKIRLTCTQEGRRTSGRAAALAAASRRVAAPAITNPVVTMIQKMETVNVGSSLLEAKSGLKPALLPPVPGQEDPGEAIAKNAAVKRAVKQSLQAMKTRHAAA